MHDERAACSMERMRLVRWLGKNLHFLIVPKYFLYICTVIITNGYDA